MIRLGLREYKDKVHACWIGKNIGGTIGAPYEGTRDMLDVRGFKSAGALPNDDLDLQLVWLQAMEFAGPKNISAYTLGEYWLAFVTPYWSEYGIATANMQCGLPPSVCGDFFNVWRDSNGAWIRTEIWAALAPACPDIAAKYAIEDARIDHGSGEGVTAAAFVAALESAAFLNISLREIIDIALSRITENSRTAQTVRFVQRCFDEGKTVSETRNAVCKMNSDIGDGWFQAPSNVGFAVLGLLYGGGDYKKSVLTAVNCGDDTDCTGATVGAVLGILNGTKGIPADWRAHIGDGIATACINLGISVNPPENCSELTERIIRLAPAVLAENDAEAIIVEGKTEYTEKALENIRKSLAVREALSALRPYSFTVPCSFFDVTVTYDGEPVISPFGEKKFTLTFYNKVKAYGNRPYNLHIRLILPDAVTADKTDFGVYLPHWTTLTPYYETAEVTVTVRAGETVSDRLRITAEISADGHYAVGYVPIVLLNRELSADIFRKNK